MISHKAAKKIRTSKAFKDFLAEQWLQKKTMKEIASLAGEKFGLRVSYTYVSQTLLRTGKREKTYSENYKRPASPYDCQLGNL